jgi:hypothetical protein
MATDVQFQRDPALRSLAAACTIGEQTAIANVNFDTARATEPGTYRPTLAWSLLAGVFLGFVSILKGPKFALPG